jgi:Cd2+/Zn2+-exporting ATPase
MPEAYEEIPGKGVRVRENGREILCGSKNMLEENGIVIPAEHAADQVHTAQNGQYLGSFHLSDALRKEAPSVLAALQKLKISSVTVLTGDSEKGAQAVIGLPNISKVYTGLLPEGKVGAVREIASSGRHVAFVGDGINDAPVLAAAHIGIAMGGIGSQAAMEAADCVLAAGTLSALPEGIKTAKRTAFIVRANVAIALIIKLLVMALGIMGLAGMWLAVIADVGVSLLCVLLTGVIRLRKGPRQA